MKLARLFSKISSNLAKLPVKNEMQGLPRMNRYYVSTDKNLLDKPKIRNLLGDCFWSKNIPIEYVERFVKHSLCFGVYAEDEDHKLVGFGRVISDFTTYAYVCDIVVDPQYRKQGIGNQLFRSIMAHSELKGLKTWALRTSDEAKNIYLKNGFSVATHPETQLEINNLDIYTCPDFKNIHQKSEDNYTKKCKR